MSFRAHHSLTGYARAAVDLKARMDEYLRGSRFREYVDVLLAPRLPGDGQHRHSGRVTDAVSQAAATVWRVGEPFVLAPAMTAVVAAAAQALDLTGEVITDQVAPCDWGVLFLPEPIYRRGITGQLSALAAITWSPITSPSGRLWLVGGWADRGDPHDPHAARIRAAITQRGDLSAMLGPYVLTDIADLPVGVPVPSRTDLPHETGDVHEWETSPEGRYVIADQNRSTKVCAAVLYAFWRIAAQPLATVTRPPLDRAARRRAARTKVAHDTRVVMLRRHHGMTGLDRDSQSPPRWRYQVRFVVRGHWRRLYDRHGNPYRIWINAYLKGPDDAPLMHGEKVAVLAR